MTHRYIIERDGLRGDRLATGQDVADFLEASGIQRESQAWRAGFAGSTVEADGSSIRVIPVSERDVATVPADWIVKAYPLQHFRIDLQGTRHSSRQSIIEQLEDVLARLRAGENEGTEHDDDFGYRFSVTPSATESVFGGEPSGRR
jgi:hypothetical protein